MSRLTQLYAISAKYRLDTHLPDLPELLLVKKAIRLHPKAIGKKHNPLGLKLALEEMGVLFLKLGQLLSTRSDLLPANLISQLVLLQDQVKPFDTAIAKQIVEDPQIGLGASIDKLFKRFDDTPLAAASIAQVHTAQLFDDSEVVVKVVRPDIKQQIIKDFEIIRKIGAWLSARLEVARALYLTDIIEDYRQIMLGELNLTFEADNATKMRNNFLGSSLIYVPKIYQANTCVMVSERVYGLPISQTKHFDALGYDRERLANNGLKIFFTQVFKDNFFHADMHPGNILVETKPDGTAVNNPRYIGLDCAIMGQLPKNDQLTVARMLLAVMNGNFHSLVEVIWQAGWIAPSSDRHALQKDMARTLSPIMSKPIDELDFAIILMSILDTARRHRMTIPPQLMLLLKTLVHVEGLGRQLYPKLDIWVLARPILTDWVKSQLDPIKNLQDIHDDLPQLLLSTAELPKLVLTSLQSLASTGARQDQMLREMQAMRADFLNQKRYDTIAFGMVAILGCIAIIVPFWWLSVACLLIGVAFLVWRILK